jgi:hypothetical protein
MWDLNRQRPSKTEFGISWNGLNLITVMPNVIG